MAVIKRSSALLVFFFTLCLSITVNALPSASIDFNLKNITTAFEKFERDIAACNVNRASCSMNYEALVEKLHEINILQSQVATCIKSSQSRMDKINHLFQSIDVPLIEKKSYNYLSAEKARQEIQITNCSFVKYRLDEIWETIVAKIDTINTNKLFNKTNSGWLDFNPSLLFNSIFNIHDLYQDSGFGRLNQTDWASLALIWLYGLLMILVLFRIGIKQLIKNNSDFAFITNAIKPYMAIIFPLSLVVLYLHFTMRPMTQPVAVVLFFDALLAYSIILSIIHLVLTLLVKGNPWPKALSLFTTIVFWVTGLYVYVIDAVINLSNSMLSHFINFQFITYCLVIARIAIGLPAPDQAWICPKEGHKIQRKLVLISTVIFLGYIISIFLKTLAIPVQIITWFDTASIVFLNLASIWIIWMVLKTVTFKTTMSVFVRKTTFVILIIAGGLSIMMAASGYHYFAINLLPNLIVTAVVLLIIWDVTKMLSRFYIRLSDPDQRLSQKLRKLLGISTGNKLVEIFFLRLMLNIPIIVLSLMSLMQIWGVTRYQITNIFIEVKAGFSIFGATIYPALIVRAVNVFCVIVLAGRALATHISHHKQFSKEEHSQLMIVSLIQYISFIIAILVGLFIAGVDLQGILVLGGALTFGLGFALQNFARDFVGGLMIVFNKPIKIGDHVIVEFNRSVHEGYIKKIGAVSTQLRTATNSDVIVPNSVIITNCVVNLTDQDNQNPNT